MTEPLTIAVIPARGGSKRIPRKNIRPFLGVPLIVRPIATLLESNLFDHVVVSTEDDEIAEIAEAAGAWVPFRRSVELADDHTPTVPVILDAIEKVEAITGRAVGEVCVTYPAAVFMTVDHLTGARRLAQDDRIDIVMTAAEFPAPIMRAWRQTPDGSAEMVWPEHRNTRSQDLEPAFYDAGQFYWWAAEAHIRLKTGLDPSVGLLVLDPSIVQDIDTEVDWAEAERKAIHLGQEDKTVR